MSDDLVDVKLSKSRIEAGGVVTAALTYTSDDGGRVRIFASNGFDVSPELADLPAGARSASVELTLSPTGPLAGPTPCALVFVFVVNFREARVNVDPPAAGRPSAENQAGA